MQVWQTIQYVMTFVGCQCMYLLCNEFHYLVFCKVIAPILSYDKCHWQLSYFFIRVSICKYME